MAISLIGEDDGFNLPALEKHLQTRFKLQQFDFDDVTLNLCDNQTCNMPKHSLDGVGAGSSHAS